MTKSLIFSEHRHQAWVQLHYTYDMISKCEETTFVQKAGISHQQFLVLMTIESIDGLTTAAELARRLQRNANTISMIADRLEKLGLVKKVRSRKDRRLVYLKITQLGKEKLEQALRVGWGLIERLTSCFSEEELHLFASLLEKLRLQAFRELGLGEDANQTAVMNFQKSVRILENTEDKKPVV